MTDRKLNCVDLFAGCGGLSLGLAKAGFRTLAFSELSKDAAATFTENLGKGIENLGDITALSDKRVRGLRREWDDAGYELDLVSGGPPCQGYSGIGHRRSYKVERRDIPSNHLFREMIRVSELLQPKLILFENVRGLLSGRWSATGKRGEIWRDVRSAFRDLRGYEVGWRVVHAKEFGVPQNRPRVILVAARRDLDLELDEDRHGDESYNPRGLIPEGEGGWPDLVDVFSDLEDRHFEPGETTIEYLRDAQSEFQERLRTRRDGTVAAKGDPLTEQEYSRHSPHVRERFEHLIRTGGKIPSRMRTKKFGQKVLPRRWPDAQGPTITVASLPDDYVHYSTPRILTVREWARLQTFPDWFRFCGPRTTGGLRRAGVPTEGRWEREVPKYTQIGNAVPVLMAERLGRHLGRLLKQTK